MRGDVYGLTAIPRDDSFQPEIDVVFIHGLNGGSRSTWSTDDGSGKCYCWPDALAEVLPTCQVWSFGYPSGITRFGKGGMTIDERTRNFARQLSDKNIGDRPLVFIAHSMGGLIIKNMLISHENDCVNIRNGLKGVIFCGTPHLGSAYPTALAVLSRVSSPVIGLFLGPWYWSCARLVTYLIAPRDWVNEMNSWNTQLDEKHKQFEAWHKRNPQVNFLTFYETQPVFSKSFFGKLVSFGLVVDQRSADTGVGPRIPVDADHIDLVKPHPSKDQLFAVVFNGSFNFVLRHVPSLNTKSMARSNKVMPGTFQKTFTFLLSQMLRVLDGG